MSMERVLVTLIDEAREMGGDGIIGLQMGSQAMAAIPIGNAYRIDHDPTLSGTVIRFVHANCHH